MAETIDSELLARHLQAIRGELRDMKYSADNDRRNIRSQFDNLAATHGSQLGDIGAKMAARLDIVETLFGDRFRYLDERIDHLDAPIGSIEAYVGRNAQQMEHLISVVEKIAQDK